MNLSNHFQFAPPANHQGTIQLELSGGGAHGAYECGALEVLVPFWQERGFHIDVVTGVSAGAINAVLLSYALNTDQDLKKIMDGFWNKIADKGNMFLAPMLELYSLTNSFNFFADPENKFPNIPHPFMSALKLGGKSSLPLGQLKSLLKEYIPPSGWDAIRNGATQTFAGALKVNEKTGERIPVLFTGQNLSPDTIIASAALRDFAPYHIDQDLYEDGGYDKIGFFLKDHKTDVLFAIGLKPLRDAAELEDHRGVKTGQLHHDLARYYLDPERTCHIDFLCLDHPKYWNETSAMNNTSRNIDMLRRMGRADAMGWIGKNGAGFGTQSSFKPNDAILNLFNSARPALQAA